MPNQPSHVDATFYAQVLPNSRGWSKDAAGNQILDGARVVALTQTKPTKPKPGSVTIKLTVRIPSQAFLPLAPEAVVVVPADMVEGHPIEVEATDPRTYAEQDA
jgi:hypothetical protein